MANEKAQLGEKIRTARAAKGWKQKHLAAEVDVEPITVSRWERGATTPDLDVLGLVAEATGKPSATSSEVKRRPRRATPRPWTRPLAARGGGAAHRRGDDRIAALLEELRAELDGRAEIRNMSA